MEHSRLEFISIWAEEFKHRIPEEHQGDGHYNSTGDMEQGRRNHPLPTQLQRNHPTITKTQHSPTGKRLRRTNNLVQIKIPQPHQHSKARQILHLAQNPQGTALIQKINIPVCHIHPAIRVPLLQRRHVLHIRGRDEPLPGPGKRAHLRGPERKSRTTAGLHRHTR